MSHDVDLPVQQRLELLGQTDEIQKGAVGLHVDHQIEIARRTVVAARDRSEHAHVPRTMPGGNVDDRIALLFEVHGGSTSDIVDRHHSTPSPAALSGLLERRTSIGTNTSPARKLVHEAYEH